MQRGARTVSLTRTEYALLETLMRRAGAVVPRDVLMEEGWGMASEVSGANLYVFVRSLRSKITQPGETELLHTVRGVGYSLRSEAFDRPPFHIAAVNVLVFIRLLRWTRPLRRGHVVQPRQPL